MAEKIIICGSRHITSLSILRSAVIQTAQAQDAIHSNRAQVVTGGARGVDALGYEYASVNLIDLKVFKADWNTHGKKAGPMRNEEMANYATCCLAIVEMDKECRGTWDMISRMVKKRKRVWIYYV